MNKIILFAAISASVFQGFAQANITNLTPDVVINATYAGESYTLDFNNDLTPDLNIIGLKKDTTFSGFPVTITGFAINTLNSTEIAGATETVGPETVIVADTLNVGDIIDATLNYVSASNASIFPGVGLGADASGFSSVGRFLNKGFKYVAVKFDASGNTHYGWIRLSVNANATVCTIDGYGYDGTSNAAAYAGKGAGISYLSVKENFSDLKIYTFKNNLYIQDSEAGNVEIFNLLGNKIDGFISTKSTVKSLEDYPSGVYLINYKKGNTTQTFKVSK